MNPPFSERPESGFAWEAERRFPLIFAGLLFLSLLGHAAAFFIFQITYPQRVTIPPLAPQVTVLSPDLPEHQQLLAWIAAEDPALSAGAARASTPGIQQIPYLSSYAAVRTWPRSTPRRTEPVPLPAGRSSVTFIEAASQQYAPPSEPLSKSATSLSISEPLAARTMKGTFAVRPRGTEPLRPAEFLLGVSSSGEVRYSFLQRSSGNSSLDDDALAELAKLSFSASQEPITWGFVTVSWGDDAYIESSEIPEAAR